MSSSLLKPTPSLTHDVNRFVESPPPLLCFCCQHTILWCLQSSEHLLLPPILPQSIALYTHLSFCSWKMPLNLHLHSFMITSRTVNACITRNIISSYRSSVRSMPIRSSSRSSCYIIYGICNTRTLLSFCHR